MEIEAFNQCLAYLQASSDTKPSLDAYLGIVGTLAGTVAGFLMNHYVSTHKEKTAALQKKEYCKGDIQELMNICEHSLVEVFQMMAELAQKNRPKAHRLPSNIRLPLLEKLYPEVAGSYNSDQQIWIKLIMRYLEDVNNGLANILDSRSETSLYKISLTLVNLQTTLYDLFKLSLCVLGERKVELPSHEQAMFDIGIPHSSMFAYQTLVTNIQRDDAMLGLDKNAYR